MSLSVVVSRLDGAIIAHWFALSTIIYNLFSGNIYINKLLTFCVDLCYSRVRVCIIVARLLLTIHTCILWLLVLARLSRGVL